MKRSLAALLFIPLLISLTFCSSMNKLSKDKLMEGSPVPEKRAYPLSKKIKACENFHKYVCSEVEDNFKLPDDRSRWTFSFTDLAEKLLHAKKSYFKKFENGYVPSTKRGLQVHNVYMACMNKESAAAEEKALVQSTLEKIKSLKNGTELAALEQKRFFNGNATYTGFFIDSNNKDPLIYDAFIYADMRSLPERSYYKNKKLIKEYKAVLADFFKTIGMDKPKTRAQHVINFETKLAMRAPLPREFRQRWTENRNVTKKQFAKRYPKFQLNELFNRMPANALIRDILPENNKYINQALRKTPIDQLKSVYAYHSISDLLDDAYPAYFKKAFDFRHKFLGGKKVRSPRQERCTKSAMRKFGMEIDKELLPVLFAGFPEKRVVKIGERIRETIIKGLKKNSWLSDKARKEAINKVKFAKLFLVKPQREQDWDFMPVREYSENKPYSNAFLYSKTRIEKKLKELAEKKNPDRWNAAPLDVNAYYNPPDNKFTLLQGILQPPFFDASASDTENIAAIGMVVGHELGHGIDDEGSKWDYQGKVRQWMQKSDIKAFKKRGKRFVAQFNKIGHDGSLTLGENIGDHVGLTFAYNTAFPDPQKAKQSDKQKFFRAYGKLWCGVATPAWEKKRLKTDPHALGRERINQQVIHIDGFYDAYGCTQKDKMFLSKDKRIRVW